MTKKYRLCALTIYITDMSHPIDENDVMEILREQNIIPMILYLDEVGEALQKDLKAISKNTVKNIATAERLQSIGVLEIEIVNRPRRTIIYRITAKGARLAEVFRRAVDIAKS